MDVGLACSTCGQLNSLESQNCPRCGGRIATAPPIAPTPGSYPNSGPPAGGGMNGAGSAPRSPAPAAFTEPPMVPARPQAQPSPSSTAAPGAPTPRFDPKTGAPLQPEGASEGRPSGGKPASKTMFFGALQQEHAIPRLVVIKGEGADGVTYHLSGTVHVVGRHRGDITFGDDIFLSPEHAKFTSQNGRLFVQDLGTTNGIFVRIKRPAVLTHDSLFLVGEQLLRLDARPLPESEINSQGTYFYGSPRCTGAFRVIQQLAGGGDGMIKSANEGSLTIGREGNDLDFPTDRFISGKHARLDHSPVHGNQPVQVVLTDSGSKNGTFIRIREAHELFHGDYLFVGQQLFRVEIS